MLVLNIINHLIIKEKLKFISIFILIELFLNESISTFNVIKVV
jgi:hypothetical protein